MEAHIGVNRRIFPTNFVDTDDQHVRTKHQYNERAYLVKDGLTGPNALFEHHLLDNLYPRTREEIYQYEIREPNALGKKPKIVQDLAEDLVPVGLYEVTKGIFPYNLYELQQKQYELSLNDSLEQSVMINGTTYETSKIADFLASEAKKTMKSEPTE